MDHESRTVGRFHPWWCGNSRQNIRQSWNRSTQANRIQTFSWIDYALMNPFFRALQSITKTHSLHHLCSLPRCECYDYLFDVAVQMKQCGLDPSALPTEAKGIVWQWEAHYWHQTLEKETNQQRRTSNVLQSDLSCSNACCPGCFSKIS